MSKQNPIKRKVLPKIFLFLAIVVLGAIYVRYTWIRFEKEQSGKILQVARSIEAILPKEDLKKLEAKPGDIEKPAYQVIKSTLKAIIRVNPEARFAYIYTEHSGKIYFIADSEPVESKDYSPPGQEYTEAKSQDKQPFRDGKEMITAPMSDRWGTWISVFIPIKDEVTGKTIAVFGLDFSAKSWNHFLLFEVFESTVLIVLLLFAFLFMFNIKDKNELLRTEITERKRAEEAMQASEEKYRLLFFNSPQPMWIYDLETLSFLEVNQAAIERYGYTKEEFSLMTLKDIRPPEDIPALLKDIEQTTNTYNLAGEWRHLRKNGELMFVEITSHAVTFNGRNARHVLINDITKRRQAEESLRRSEESFRSIFENNSAAIIIIEPDSTISMVNEEYCILTGYQKQEVVGMSWTKKIPPEDLVRLKEYNRIRMINPADAPGKYEFSFHHKNGEIRHALMSVTMLNNRKIIGSFVDITFRKHAEVTLKEALVKAESGDRLKSAFLQNISHEVRTPLNGILGFGNLLAEPDLTSEEKQNYTRFLKASSDRLINTITDYIDISLIVTGNVEVSLKAVNTTNVLKELQTRFQHDCDAKNIMLKLEIPKDQEHLTLITDPELLHKSISSLLNNAIKFTNHGTVTMGYSIKSHTVEFFVIDTGIGIDAEAREKIFEPFVHQNLTETLGYQGSGLGLPIIKGFLKLLGGDIRLESEKGKGAAFFFSLPLEQGTTQENEPIDPLIGHVEIIRPVILVAEDDLYSDFYMEVILKSIASIVIKAANGKEAVEMCRLHPEISIVLMDVKMPVMDGLEATRQIKSFRKDLPVIAVTAYALSRDKKKALDAGCDDFLSKPVSKKELLEKLKKLGFVV